MVMETIFLPGDCNDMLACWAAARSASALGEPAFALGLPASSLRPGAVDIGLAPSYLSRHLKV